MVQQMSSSIQTFFSNQTELLFEDLKANLFTGTTPFSKRLVIVPSPAMKSWISAQLAQDLELKVAAGIQITFLEPGIHHLHALLSDQHNEKSEEPDELELSFALEAAMVSLCKEFPTLSPSIQELWQPIMEYLGLAIDQKVLVSLRASKRMTALSSSLAKIFIDYGRYGGKLLIGWEKGLELDWQFLLWKRMEKVFALWNYPYRKFEAFKMSSVLAAADYRVHIFGLSYIPPLYHRFLQKVSAHISVNYYFLSPCQKFWSDILSDKESSRLKNYWNSKKISTSQYDDLEAFLTDSNPLLANFGKMGREMVREVESEDYISKETYALPSSILEQSAYQELLSPDDLTVMSTTESLTLLQAMQTDILLLRNPNETEKIAFSSCDGSIQIHAAPKVNREVQAVYDLIMSLIEKHSQDEVPLCPGDILVMSTNVAEYAPFIRNVFESPESQLKIQISDLQAPMHNRFIQGFLHLLDIANSRWDSSSLLQLFEYPAFLERFHFGPDDKEVIQEWVKSSGIRWGKDEQHRNELLKMNHCTKDMDISSGGSTWENGLRTLLESLAFYPDEKLSKNSAFEKNKTIETSQGRLLGMLLQLVRSLEADLKPLTGQSQRTLKEWSNYLKCLCDSYFAPGKDEEATAGNKILIECLEAIGNAGSHLEESRFSFYPVQKHLLQKLQEQSLSYHESHLNAVKFCSLVPMRVIPAKVIILMGLGDGMFPRANQIPSVNKLPTHGGDYYPSQEDFDRYLFLEALLSARAYFIMTYVSQSPGDPQEELPSLLIKEMMQYLDQAYELPDGNISTHCYFKHSLFPFHKQYFLSQTGLKSYSKRHFEAAQAYYNETKMPSHRFLSAFAPLSDAIKHENKPITLSELAAFARNPLKTYFNKALGIYIHGEEKTLIQNEEEFLLSPLYKSMLLKAVLHAPPKTIWEHAAKDPRFPVGPFKRMEAQNFLNEAELLKKTLDQNGIMELFSIEFSMKHQAVHFYEGCWHMPALDIEIPGNGHLQIIGKLEAASSQGLMIFSENSIEDAVKAWPIILLFCCLIEKYHLPIAKQIFFVKDEKSPCRGFTFNDVEQQLQRFLVYYLKGKQTPSPLIPEWISSFLSGSVDTLRHDFQKKENEGFHTTFNHYLQWLQKNSAQVDLDSLLPHWQGTAQALFSDLNASWYSKKRKSPLEAVDDTV